MIDKRISMSKKIGNVTDKAKVLWFMIYPHLDCEGRIAFDDLQDLKVEIMPYFKNWGLKKIEIAFNELADIKLLKLYPHQQQIATQFNRFEDFQIGLRKDREAKSEIPPQGRTPESSGNYRIFALRLNRSLSKEGRKKKEEILKKKEIHFDFEARKWINIKIEDKSGWLAAYPACDIDLELYKMREWLLANPDKRKKNYRRFIVNWLTRTQDKGGSEKIRRHPGGHPMTRKEQAKKELDEWEKKPLKKKD